MNMVEVYRCGHVNGFEIFGFFPEPSVRFIGEMDCAACSAKPFSLGRGSELRLEWKNAR